MPLIPALQPYAVFDSTYGIWFLDEEAEEDIQRFAQSEATRTITCSGADRITLINNLGGIANLNPFNLYNYVFAASYPDAPSLLYYNSCKTKQIPVGGLTTDANGLVTAALYRCAIRYRSQPYVEQQGTVTAVKLSVQDIALTQQPGTFVFGSSSGPPVDPSQFPATQGTFIDFAVTTFNNISLPESTMLMAAANPIDTSGLFGTQTGYLLYAGSESTRRMNQAGIEMWDITNHALFSPTGWGYALNPASGMFEEVWNTVTKKPVYPRDDSGAIPALFSNSGL